MKQSPKKILLIIVVIIAGLAMVHFCFVPGLRAISTWIVYKTEGQKLQRPREDYKLSSAKETKGQPAGTQDLYRFGGDEESKKP